MDRFIKSSAITFGGYVYQNFIGLKVLLDWLEDPGLYEWVIFESDKEEDAKGLDDIVAKRADTGKFVRLQVKFTADPHDERNRLTWDWLLLHKPKGTSLIQKWSRAFFALGEGSIAEAALITNREPDRAFEACLIDNKISFDRVPEPIKSQIVSQLGGEESASLFFAVFGIRHSYQGYDSLHSTLRDRYVPRHTDFHGWHVLRSSAIDWAIRTNCPPPDGYITLSLLRGTLSTRRPKPLSESFRVPDGYLPPDSQFDDDFLRRVLTGDRRVAILWGSPGQGKSTYLSHVCQRLVGRDIPYIRHHYFLSLSETENRLSFLEVSNTLMHQIEVQHGDQVQGIANAPENLGQWIAACGASYADQGKRFVVVVDGLDHVWRENDKNREPLESLFRHLLPLPNNVVLVIGTQRVRNEQLPPQLLLHAKQDDWVELPLMSLAATKNWLHQQASSGRFELQKRSVVEHEDPLTAIAETFHKASRGHPLHLTYSLEAAIKQHRTLTPECVQELPECPDGDIRKYYRSLWIRLSNVARDALHLIAGAGFTWPYSGLEECLTDASGRVLDEIGHLLYRNEAGFTPFHGSLLVYIAEDSEHTERLKLLMPSVRTWLETKAPPYLKWGWLWLVNARTGDTAALLNGPSREWVVSSLCKAYPTSQITKVLAAAEQLAFEQGLYARAVRLRWLKVRVLNGIDFQLDDFDQVYECSLTMSDDDYPRRNLSANFHSASVDELHMLARQYEIVGRREDVIECQEEIRKRLNDRIKSGAYDRRSLEAMSESFLELVAKTGKYDPKQVTDSIRNFGDLSDSLFQFFVRKLSEREDPALLLPFLNFELTSGMRRDLELQIIRVAGYCQARIDEWPEFDSLKEHPIVGCWAQIYCKAKYKTVLPSLDIKELDKKSWENVSKESKDSIVQSMHSLFFQTLAQCLEFRGAAPPLALPTFSNRPWMNTAIGLVVKVARLLGNAIAHGTYPDFAASYRILADESSPKNHDEFGDYLLFRKAILEVSTDLFLLLSIRSGSDVIGAAEWQAVTASPHFNFSEWRNSYLAAKQRIVTASIIESEVKKRLLEEEGHVTQFNERAQLYLELCELALFQRTDIIARQLLRKTIECVLGHGWHKDMTLFYVLDAIAAVATIDQNYARAALEKVSPIVESIDVLTDGDETNHLKYELADLLVQMLPRSFTGYYQHLLKTSEWYEADRVFSKLLSREDLRSPMGAFVAGTVWDSHGIGALRGRIARGETEYQNLVDISARGFGMPQEDLGKERHSSSTPMNEVHNLNIEEYGPDALKRLLADLDEKKVHVGARKALREWFDLWVSRSHGSQVLRELHLCLDKDKIQCQIAELLDDAIELSFRLEGKAKAYRWAVAAQIHCHGWEDLYSDEKTLRRFQAFGKNFRDKWQEFIFDSTRRASRYGSETLVIPHHRLVQFFVAVGQVELAKAVADTMIDIAQEEMGDQPLKKPSWLVAG